MHDPGPDDDVCVVGAGPVGQSVARELARAGLRVVVVEAGVAVPSAGANNAVSSTVEGDDRYGGLPWKAWRAWGGTSWAWGVDVLGQPYGVRLAAFEEAVVERRSTLPRWPLPAAQLRRLQQRALSALGVPLEIGALGTHGDPGLPGIDESRYAFASGAAFHEPMDVPGVRVLLGCEVTGLGVEAEAVDTVRHVEFRRADGSSGALGCRAVVLAASAVENARLTLLLGRRSPSVAANRAVGLGFMDRPRLTGTLRLDGPAPQAWAAHALRRLDQSVVMDRWCSPSDQVRAGSPSAGLVLAPAMSPDWRSRLAARSRRTLVDVPVLAGMYVTDHRSPQLAGTLMRRIDRTYPWRAALHRRMLGNGCDLEWADWSRLRWRAATRWTVTASLEQLPVPANAVRLAADGTARLVWGRPVQRQDVDGVLQHITSALAHAGVGTLTWPEQGFDSVSSHHLMGGLAFGDDVDATAADADGRVRGTRNLFAAGACLFPTSGHANPTLTAVALGLHVADAVAGQLRGELAAGPAGSAAGTAGC